MANDLQFRHARMRPLEDTPAGSGERHVVLRGPSPDRNGRVLKRHASGKATNTLDFADALCAASAAIRASRRAHVACFGALIPHVFMGEVLRHVGACLEPAAFEERLAELEAVLVALEHGLTVGDAEVRNVIATSFLRDAAATPFFARLRPMMGPKLRACRR